MIFVLLWLAWKAKQSSLTIDVGEQYTNKIRQGEKCRSIGSWIIRRRKLNKYDQAMSSVKRLESFLQ